jgi:hypothetical protein
VRFLLFPGAPHGLQKPSHRRRKLAEELAWFDRHFFGKAEEPPEPPQSSEIARAKALGAAKRDGGGRLGVVEDGALLPETAPFAEGKAIGRFEVTVAQWRAFDPECVYGIPAALRESPNHPATALTADGIERYLAWLGERSRATWRLPTAEEFAALEKKGGGGNTLDRWVGHPPAAADGERYAAMVAALGLAHALLEAGQLAPAKIELGGAEHMVWDLAGNAAERVRKPDGRIGVAGGWALASPDPLVSSPPEPPPEYIGLRVVRELPPDEGKRARF